MNNLNNLNKKESNDVPVSEESMHMPNYSNNPYILKDKMEVNNYEKNAQTQNNDEPNEFDSYHPNKLKEILKGNSNNENNQYDINNDYSSNFYHNDRSNDVLMHDQDFNCYNNTHNKININNDGVVFDNNLRLDSNSIKNNKIFNNGGAKLSDLSKSNEKNINTNTNKCNISNDLSNNVIANQLEQLNKNNYSNKNISFNNSGLVPPKNSENNSFNNSKIMLNNNNLNNEFVSNKVVDSNNSILNNKDKVKNLLNFNGNNLCFDCNSHNVSWVHITLGIFLCINCAKDHKIMFKENNNNKIKSIDVNNFDDKELNLLASGGNNKLKMYLSMYNLIINDNSSDKTIKSFNSNKYFNQATIYYIKNLNNIGDGKSDKLYNTNNNSKFIDYPSIEEGRKPASVGEIHRSLGIFQNIKEKTKELLGIKTEEEVKANMKLNADTENLLSYDKSNNIIDENKKKIELL